jgi:hypothetical protein
MVGAAVPPLDLDVGYALDWQADLRFAAVWFVAIFVIDFAMVRLGWFPEAKSATRYFSLHVIVNAYVVYVHLPDVVITYLNPSAAYLGPCETRGVAAIFALHFYHMAFYRPLPMVDWVRAAAAHLVAPPLWPWIVACSSLSSSLLSSLSQYPHLRLVSSVLLSSLHAHLSASRQVHHIVMVVVMLPLAYLLAPGHLFGHGSFYASGLPGTVRGQDGGPRSKGVTRGLHLSG